MPAVNRLAELRTAAELSRAALADEIGVDASTLWRWEKRKVAIPDKHKLALAERFGVTVGYLMGWESTRTEAAA